jgi:diaminopimelate epimerase
MSAPFIKMAGAGNDFIVLDDRDGSYADVPAERWSALCSRRTGIGADGVLLLQPSRDFDYRMRYVNADGSETDMCGNGARCLAWMAAVERGLGNEFTGQSPRPDGWRPPPEAAAEQIWTVGFEANDGIHRAIGWGQQVVVSLGECPGGERCTVETSRGPQTGLRLSIGVPHFVLRVDDPDVVDVEGIGRELRNDPYFAPAGTNVDWLSRNPGAGDAWAIRTYERGVEAETLSCGTGSTAAAVTLALEGAPSPVRLRTHGGDLLTVHYQSAGAGVTDLWLAGPVTVVYRGIVEDIQDA